MSTFINLSIPWFANFYSEVERKTYCSQEDLFENVKSKRYVCYEDQSLSCPSSPSSSLSLLISPSSSALTGKLKCFQSSIYNKLALNLSHSQNTNSPPP